MKKLYLFTALIYLAQLCIAQVTVTVTPNFSTICAGSQVTLTASATSGSPGTITYDWSPSTGLNTSSGATVIATPDNSITYTVTAKNQSTGQTASANANIDINPDSYVLAAEAGQPAVCRNLVITAGGTIFRDGNCKIIAGVVPAGANPVTNSVNTCTQLLTGASKMGTTNLYLARKYDIEPSTNAATATANITLYYLQKDFDDYNDKASDSGFTKLPSGPDDLEGIGNLCVRQFHGTGTSPGQYSGSSHDFMSTTPGVVINWDSKNDIWEVTVPVTGFSGFYITSLKGNSLLPIAIEYFRGAQSGKMNVLNWKANCTSPEVTFEIERSETGMGYSTIGRIHADQARCNMPFDYIDASPVNGKNYYRLKIIDETASFKYSGIVLLNVKIKKFELVGMNPNLIGGEDATVKVNALQKSEMLLAVTDMSGRKIQHQTISLRPGLNSIKISTATLSSGAYLLGAYMSGEDAQTIQFIKQ